MIKLFNLRTATFISLSLIFGILFGYFIVSRNCLLAVLMCIALLFLIIALFFLVGKLKSLLKCVLSALFILCFIFGAVRFTNNVYNYENANLNSHTYSVKARVVSLTQKDGYAVLVLDDATIIGNYNKDLDYKIKLNILNCSVNAFTIGDIIAVNTALNDYSLIYNGDFSFYNAYYKIKYYGSVDFSSVAKTGFYVNIFERFNFSIKHVLSSGLSSSAFAVANALLLGDTEFLDTELIGNFRALGVSHIFAVSGLHIGFLLALLSFILTRLNLSNGLKTPLIILILFFYSGVCGFSASSLRACIMSSVYLISKAFSRKYDALSSISLSAFFILSISPLSLFQAGFSLSFVSVLGIALLSRIFTNKFKKLPFALASSLSVSLSAFIVSAPLVCAYFKTLSLLSVVFNLILIPVVTVIFYLLFFAVILSLIFGASGVFLFIPNLLIKAVVFLVSLLKINAINTQNFSFSFYIIFYYLGVLLFTELINLKKRIRFISAILSICIFFSAFGFSLLVNANTYKLYAYGSYNSYAIILERGGERYAIVSGKDLGNTTFVIDKLASNLAITEFSAVIVLDNTDFKFDIAEKLARITNTSTIYLYGDVPLEYYTLFSNMFSLSLIGSLDKDNVNLNLLEFGFRLNGLMLEFKFNDKRVLLFNDLPNNFNNYGLLEKNCHLLAFRNFGERLTSFYLPSNTLSLVKNTSFADAETNGIVTYNFNK